MSELRLILWGVSFTYDELVEVAFDFDEVYRLLTMNFSKLRLILTRCIIYLWWTCQSCAWFCQGVSFTYDELVKVAFDFDETAGKHKAEEGTGVLGIVHMLTHPYQHVHGVTADRKTAPHNQHTVEPQYQSNRTQHGHRCYSSVLKLHCSMIKFLNNL